MTLEYKRSYLKCKKLMGIKLDKWDQQCITKVDFKRILTRWTKIMLTLKRITI
jgi:hypothetical protein